MTTDALLRQILADPSDPALRIVYADALMAAGDPRGELIAVESALDRPGAHERRAALRAAHGRTWWPELPPHRIRTERGFATALSVASERIDACARLFATELIEEVELDNEARAPLAFAPSAWQARLTGLAVRGGITRAELTALGASPLGGQLETLDVTGALQGMVALGEGFPRCRRLGIAQTSVHHQIGTLLRWRYLGQLEELDARCCSLDAHGLEELLALDLGSLRVLKLSGNPFGITGTPVLQRGLRRLPRLERLELVGCGITDVTHAAIMEADELPATIDLVGAALELVPTTAGRSGLFVDGARRRLRYRSIRTEDGLPETVVEPWTEGLDAPLAALHDALGLGLARRITDTGAIVLLSSSTDVAYATSYTERDTLEIGLTGEVVLLEHERHISTGTV